MANMIYVRFQNTVTDLRDCYEHIDNENLSKEENRARTRLITLCRQIAALFDDEADDSFEDLEERHNALQDATEKQSEIIAALRNEIATKDKRIQTLLEENRKLSEKVRKC